MVANHGTVIAATAVVIAAIAMISHVGSVVAASTVRVPAAFDPDALTTAALPATGRVDIADALALVASVHPDPSPASPVPVAFDPDEARAVLVMSHARRGRLLFNFDDCNGRPADIRAAAAVHHATAQQQGEAQATEKVLASHFILQSVNHCDVSKDGTIQIA
jgi:hypothetical protein